MSVSSILYRLLIFSCVTLLTRQVTRAEISRYYDDLSICLWTDGSSTTQLAAQTVCQQRNNSFLPRVTNSNIQNQLPTFRRAAYNLLYGSEFWIDVKSVGIGQQFYWIDGSRLTANHQVSGDQSDTWTRFAVIVQESIQGTRQFVFSARRYNNQVSSYICQLQEGASCTGSDHLSMNSKCYRKFDRQLTWFEASNQCLSHGGSLAVFTDIGHPSRNTQVTQWLNTEKSYWIGLIRSWWKTTNKTGHRVDVQYSNWLNGYPRHDGRQLCVSIMHNNQWFHSDCKSQKKYVCQNYTTRTTSTSTTTTTSSTTITATTTTMSIPQPKPSMRSTKTTARTTRSTPTSPSSSTSRSSPLSVDVNETATTTPTTPTTKTTTTKSNNSPSTGNVDDNPNQSMIIGVAVGVSVLIIIAIIVLIILLLYKKRVGFNKKVNGGHTVNRKELVPIDAYGQDDNDHVTYANIVPTKTAENDVSDHQQQEQPVIYAELAMTQPPVVNADDNA